MTSRKVARRVGAGIAALALTGVLATPVAAHHCVISGGGLICAGDPRNPWHEGEGRIAGADRYATSARVSAQFWAPGEATTVYLANGQTMVDALAAGPSLDGPILLVGTDRPLHSAVEAELARLAPSRVVALGGSDVVAPWQVHAATVAAGIGQ